MLDDRSQSLSKAILHDLRGRIPIARRYSAVAFKFGKGKRKEKQKSIKKMVNKLNKKYYSN